MDTLAIIKRIEMRLSEIGMSKAEFYKKSGISSASFSQWRTGIYKPTEKKLSSAALCLGVSVDYLVSGQMAESEISLANGVHVFRSSYQSKIEEKIENLELDSYRVVYSAPGIVITVDNASNATEADIESIINFYSSEKKITLSEMALAESDALLIQSILGLPAERKAALAKFLEIPYPQE